MIRTAMLIQAVLDKIAYDTAIYGFSLNDKTVTRETNCIEQTIDLPHARLRDRIMIRVDLQIRDWPIEKFLADLSLPLYSNQLTAAVEIDHLKPDSLYPEGYPYTGSEIEEYAANISKDVINLAIPYFAFIDRREKIFDLLSKDTPFSWISLPNHFHRGIKTVALALALDKSESELLAVVNTFRNRIGITQNRHLNEFDNIVKQLMSLRYEILQFTANENY